MYELTQDEVSVLLIAREGAYLAPIARWEKPILDLTARGLMRRYDDVNYGITDAGRQAIEARDKEDFDKLREVQNKIVARQMAVENEIANQFFQCPQCKDRIQPEWRYCARCGMELRGDA